MVYTCYLLNIHPRLPTPDPQHMMTKQGEYVEIIANFMHVRGMKLNKKEMRSFMHPVKNIC